jgi:hypothetical protein
MRRQIKVRRYSQDKRRFGLNAAVQRERCRNCGAALAIRRAFLGRESLQVRGLLAGLTAVLVLEIGQALVDAFE